MRRYRANTPRFVDETVDGEALIMDMVTGSYYTCRDSSTIAWEALKAGVATSDVAALISNAYRVELGNVERDVERFVDDLLGDEMLVPLDGSAAPAPPATTNGSVIGEYQPLRFDRYTDLADLILLDPVHDVSDAGWPHEPQ